MQFPCSLIYSLACPCLGIEMRWHSVLHCLAHGHAKKQSFAIKPTPFGKDIVTWIWKCRSAGVRVTWYESPEPRLNAEQPFEVENSFPTTKSMATPRVERAIQSPLFPPSLSSYCAPTAKGNESHQKTHSPGAYWRGLKGFQLPKYTTDQ